MSVLPYRHCRPLLAIFSVLLAIVPAAALDPSPVAPGVAAVQSGSFSFEKNLGQTRPEVLYFSRGRRATLYLTRTGGLISAGAGTGLPTRVSFDFRGARATGISGSGLLPKTTTYLLGRDPQRWVRKAPNFNAVGYSQLYPGIDLVYYGRSPEANADNGASESVEFDFDIARGAEPKAIRFDIGGAKHVEVAEDGSLAIHTPAGEIRFLPPVAYQEQHPERKVACRYRRFSDSSFGFEVGPYDRRHRLRIDPVIAYSSFAGGSGSDSATAIAVDSSGNTYVAGSTDSTDFLGLSGGSGGLDAFVTKINPSGSAPLWTVYFGGSSDDHATAVALDGGSNVYIAGTTASADMPLVNGYDAALAGASDGFMAEISGDGSSVLYSTYVGGSADDSISSLAVDGAGRVDLAGATSSTDLPVTPSAVQPACQLDGSGNCADALIAQILPTLSGTASLSYLTYMGGSGADAANALAADSNGLIYVAGATGSGDLPVSPGAYQAGCSSNCADAFVAKIDPTQAGSSGLLYSSYFGGTGSDQANAITLDASGRIYVGGQTSSKDLPVTSGVMQSACKLDGGGNCSDAFVAKFDPSGSGAASLVYSTFLGGSAGDSATAIAVDGLGNAFVAGSTSAVDFPLASAVQSTQHGGLDAFLTKLNRNATAAIFSTYLGGSADDQANAITLDKSGNAVLAGSTLSSDFPVVGGIQTTCASCASSLSDAWLARLASLSLPVVSLNPTSLNFGSVLVGTATSPSTITLTNQGDATLNIGSITSSNAQFSKATTCGASLIAGAQCTVSITFKPSATGLRTATLSFTDNAAGSPQTVALSGTGIASSVQIAPTSLSFAVQAVGTTSATKAVTLTNSGTANLTVTAVAAPAEFPETDNCAALSPIAPKAKCTLNIAFSPTGEGTRTGTITISDNAGKGSQTIAVSGTGTIITVSPAVLKFATTGVGQTSAPQTVTISNTGTDPITMSPPSTTGDFAVSTTTCGASLNPVSSCTVSVTFTPTVGSAETGTLVITDSDVTSPQTVSLSGTGKTMLITSNMSNTSLTFGPQLVGTQSTGQVVTLSNTGNTSDTINGISVTGDYTSSSSCGPTLAAGKTCAVTVVFKPTDAGSRNGILTVNDSSNSSPKSVSLNGLGTYLQVTPLSLTFPNSITVGTTSSASKVTLKNMGPSAISLTGFSTTGDFNESTACPATLGSAASCTVNVTFSPSGSGARTGSLVVNSSDPAGSQVVNLMGTATFVAFSAGGMGFGSQARFTSSAPRTITITNTGTLPVTIFGITASGDYSVTHNCGTQMDGGASCQAQLIFTPSGLGSRPGYLTVSDSDGLGLHTTTMSGTGTPWSSTLTISPHVVSVTPPTTVQFTASDEVAWAVDGIVGGSPDVGFISPDGIYVPPATQGAHLVTATSATDGSQDAAQVTVATVASVVTQRNDVQRSGLNLQEIALTTGNVNKNQFQKLFEQPLDGQAYTQPLYVANVTINGTTHNVVYVATEHDGVYAFDADTNTGSNAQPLWQVSFLNPSAGITSVATTTVRDDGIIPEIGITGTPVIDTNTGTLYLVSFTNENGALIQRLHALDITSGAEKFGGPVVIQASVPGKGDGSSGGVLSFQPLREKQRPSLLLLNGVVYIAWAGYADTPPYHGWVLGYDASTLQQVVVWCDTPNGQAGGIWQAGIGLMADSTGDIYLMNGNGTFDANIGGVDYGQSILRLRRNGNTLSVVDYFTPYDFAALNSLDGDLGSGGPLLIPDQPSSPTHLIIGAGKAAKIYVVNRDNMGHFNSGSDSVVQELPGALGSTYSAPIYFQGNLYYATVNDPVKMYRLTGSMLSSTPIAQNSIKLVFPGANPAISANGSVNGILWMIQRSSTRAILRAFDAANVTRELYDSTQSATRDGLPIGTKFSVPTVVNGKVYVGTGSSLAVFGLSPQ